MRLIIEGKRDEALGMFLPLFQKRSIETNISQLKQFLLNKFVTEAGIHSLSQGSNYYLVGVARYYFSGELTNNSRLNALYPNFKDKFIPQICQRLDALVNILRGSYIDSVGTKFEQPEDFGNLSLEQLLKKYNKAINKALGIDDKKEVVPVEKETKVSNDYRSGRNYTYEILYSYDDAKKYNSYTEPGAWCITYGKQHYEGYVKRLGIHYVIFKKKGFESIPRRKGKNWTKQKPQDEYGNSLIAVLQSNKNGEPIYITSRWNHGTANDGTQCEADHAYTKEEFFKVTGCSDDVLQRAFEQWKAGVKERGGNEKGGVDRSELYAKKLDVLRTFKYAQMMINGGADLRDCIKGGRVIREAKGFKGTYLVYIEKDNETYYTVMDRKKMFYDKFLVSSEWSSSIIDATTSRYCILHDDGRKNYYIFDLIHHDFLTLDGCYKFKTTSSDFLYSRNEENIKYTVLAQSGNQIALINLETMKPIKARNGSCWFESIVDLDSGSRANRDYSGRINLPSYLDRSRVLKMTYDSAANEVYLFDLDKNQFIETRNNEDGFVLSEWQRKSKEGFIKYVKGEEGRGSGLIRYQRLGNNEWFNVNGYDTFKAIDWNEALVVGYKGYDEEMTHYVDGKTGKMLEINGNPIETWQPEMQMTSGWLAISISRNKTEYNFWGKCALFNPISRNLYHDSTSGWYFRIYGGQNRIKAYVPNSEEKYELPSPQEAIDNVKDRQQWIVDNFNDIVGRMG